MLWIGPVFQFLPRVCLVSCAIPPFHMFNILLIHVAISVYSCQYNRSGFERFIRSGERFSEILEAE